MAKRRSKRVYVLAILGESPAVLAELLWQLVKVERAHLAGVEVWTTETGERVLREKVSTDAWDDFQDELGWLAELEEPGTDHRHDNAFTCHVFRSTEGISLRDVRSRAESDRVSAELYDRVRALRDRLPKDTVLVGSLAGGRKTLSAALQTAFSLQARDEDRLVHVLLAERVEAHLREVKDSSFLFPDERTADATGVPLAEQVLVYDVAFPRVRLLVPPKARAALDDPWDEVWRSLKERHGDHYSARLVRRGDHWDFEIHSGAKRVESVELTPRLGSVFVAIIELPEPTGKTISQYLADREDLWGPTCPDPEDKLVRIRGAVSEMRTQLSALPEGFGRFVPEVHTYKLADAIEVVYPDYEQPSASPGA